MKNPTQRQIKVANLVRRELARILFRSDINVTIADLHVNSDLKIITVFIDLLSNVNEKEVLEYLNQEAPKFRKMLTLNVALKYSPSIRFMYDRNKSITGLMHNNLNV